MRTAAQIADLLGQHAPTDEQAAIIEAPLEPLLVVAGAGSGKTETMAARVVYLIANGLVEPDRILGLTFTRKAAGELSDRVRARLRSLRGRLDPAVRTSVFSAPTISTYNSYAAGLVGDHALRLGLEPSARLLGEAGRWQLAHDVVEHWAADLEVDSAASTVVDAVLSLAGQLAEHLVEPAELRAEAERLVDALTRAPLVDRVLAADAQLLRDVASSAALRARLVDLVEAFTARKRERDVLDFGDQVALAARLAREAPEVGAAERARFDVVLLDEYQDTSVAQLVLLRSLYGRDAGPGVGHPVTAVGDPHQSIYGWRGASAGGLARFVEDFPRVVRDPVATGGSAHDGGDAHDGGARTTVPAACLALSTSWRNDAAVLEAANLLAAPLRAAEGAAGIALPVLRPGPAAGRGEVLAAYLDTDADEARAVAQFVAQRRTALADQRGAGAPVTAAVLCRKRSQVPMLEHALLEAGLPVEVVGLGGLLSTPEVVDLVAALQATHDPSRGDALMRLLTGPRARLGLADLHALADWSAEHSGPARRPGAPGGPPRPAPGADSLEADVVDERSIVDALDALPALQWRSRNDRGLSEAGHRRLGDLAAVLRTLRAHTFLPVVDVVAQAERLLGLDVEVAVGPAAPATARAHLDAFRAVAAAFDADEGGTLGAFLAWLDAAAVEERGLEAPVGEVDPSAVQILTVHAAKGLEWDVVAVPGMVRGTFPTSASPRGWVKDHGALPTRLRGDRDSLPDVDLVGTVQRAELVTRLADYLAAVDAHHLGEERRLAYVALTRARHHLLLSGSWWNERVKPYPPSVFLTEVHEVAEELGWVPEPGDERPEQADVEAPVWPPVHPLGEARHARLARAAAAVRAAVSPGAGDAGTTGRGAAGTMAGMPMPSEVRATPAVAGSTLAEVTELLLDERRRGSAERTTVPVPAHLSTSAVVRLADDREGFALALRRPVPLAPSTVARRGTAFHAWVERYFGAASLVEVDALPGADDDAVAADVDLAALRDRFLASPWAGRTPIAVEVDVETPVGGVVIRSRIDAVFAEPDGGVVVVDWKTGRPPTDPATRRTRALQLAVYRVAWSRWTGLPLERVRAAFFYVATGETVSPPELDLAQIEAALAGP